jgi:hypothetical protein
MTAKEIEDHAMLTRRIMVLNQKWGKAGTSAADRERLTKVMNRCEDRRSVLRFGK